MASKPKLVIVESPAKARTISRFLGKSYHVEASQGHVRDLPKSRMGVDIENGYEPRYITIRGRGDILSRIRREAKNASHVFLATDPDREGEAISWHLAQVLDIDPASPCRIEFNEVTSRAVKAAVKQPRAIDIARVDAQQARRVLDRLVGYGISPLLWRKVRKGLSAGRVQSVATKMICDREEEVERFLPEEYWTVTASLAKDRTRVSVRYVNGDGEATLRSREECERLACPAPGTRFTLSSLKTGEKRKYPAAPFTTSNLQQEASRKLNFTTQKTMQVAQQLYEGVDIPGHGSMGLITYIRTDSTRTSAEALESVRAMILSEYGPASLPQEPNRYQTRAGAQDAHEAIRPTDISISPESVRGALTRDQYRLYRLVYDRFVSSQMTPAVFTTMTADFTGETGMACRFTAQKLTFPGFMAVYEEILDDDKAETSTALPPLKEGDVFTLEQTVPEQHFTQPPSRYTEASLVREMEEKGIGRPSTYAPTISTIIARGYVMRENRRLMPTQLGRVINDLMCENFPQIVDIAFTADMEEKLDSVEEEGADWRQVVDGFYRPFSEALERAEDAIEKIPVESEVSDKPCPECGAMLVYKMSRYGRFLACPNFPACRHTEPVLKAIDAPCPLCGSKILERTSHKGRRFFGCEKYPDCKFVSWEKPVAEKCPVCGGRMVEKRARDKVYHVCVNETCRHRTEAPQQDE